MPPEPCAPAPTAAWGWAVQLYAVRSRDSWGIGDIADLRRLARWSRSAGRVGACSSTRSAPRRRPCRTRRPRTTRRRAASATRCTCASRRSRAPSSAPTELAPLRDAAQHLNDARLIDYDEVFRLKSQALEAVFHAAPEPRGLAAWARGKGRALRDFATFNALAEVHGPAWRDWPSSLRHPRSRGVDAERSRGSPIASPFTSWQQFHLDRQLARAAREIDLITDVPVGFASDGFDAWRWQDLLAPGHAGRRAARRVLPRRPGLGPASVRPVEAAPRALRAVRRGDAQRGRARGRHPARPRDGAVPPVLDPERHDRAAGGAYVRYPRQRPARHSSPPRAGAPARSSSARTSALSSRRCGGGCAARGALSYRLLWFEGPSPDQWPRNAVAAIGTHDLPTVAGIWNLTEPDQRQHRLRAATASSVTHAPDGTPPIDVAVAAYAALARSPLAHRAGLARGCARRRGAAQRARHHDRVAELAARPAAVARGHRAAPTARGESRRSCGRAGAPAAVAIRNQALVRFES